MDKFEKHELKLKWFSGFLSADPDMKFFESGKCNCRFSIPLKDGENTDWLNCVAWSNLAEKISENYKKGSYAVVGGNFEEREYNGKQYLDFNVKVIS